MTGGELWESTAQPAVRLLDLRKKSIEPFKLQIMCIFSFESCKTGSQYFQRENLHQLDAGICDAASTCAWLMNTHLHDGLWVSLHSVWSSTPGSDTAVCSFIDCEVSGIERHSFQQLLCMRLIPPSLHPSCVRYNLFILSSQWETSCALTPPTSTDPQQELEKHPFRSTPEYELCTHSHKHTHRLINHKKMLH